MSYRLATITQVTRSSSRVSQRGTVFPIVEAYGYHHSSTSPEARNTWAQEYCPFAKMPCEKKRQYHYGYCSVTYAAGWDKGKRRTYAVCDHRLDGPPVQWAVTDYFGQREATLVPEVTITDSPKLNIDYMAFVDDPSADGGTDIIAIETQAIDLRGGGVGPAWEAWEEGDVPNWRAYFTKEAKAKNRRDTVDYGVNTGNVYKRLGTQVAAKGEILKQVHIPLYVVMQQIIFEQLRARVNFEPVDEGEPWDITFVGFDYDAEPDQTGQLPMSLKTVVRTSLENYVTAMMSSSAGDLLRHDVIARAKRKAKPPELQGDLLSELGLDIPTNP
ncbi:hypothetical protein C5E45_16615 [Nocardia nova]|uniref:Uncharacterized protein n=1 Tax=Nocardia nova TaxID=37330 RepID=A0A2S6AQ11_9NOCA|nr:NotI family restriction endonuclease [Nocardia nova]PPJ19756.1 hypothetical protein C5E41_30710 [Nocardia nova]PPJ37266.1 hypothetical protein C5E45_16615 [Nocardia nova]